jgi:serine/threonine-protein phosphatase 4 regulatory subunit 1
LEQLTPAAYYCDPQQQQLDELLAALPTFLHAARMSAWSLNAVTEHRQQHPPAAADIDAVVAHLLDYFVALAAVNTGDENTNAEMRVYCAYSFPAIVLLLGKEHWEGPVRMCFHTLLNPRYPEEDDSDDDDDDEHSSEPPLPVKRCLASSLHTVAHILGETITETDIIGVVQNCFLTDSDDSVRLSTIRNFPALLKCLPMRQRREPFLLWSSVVLSDDMLGGGGGKKQRSATNPTVLNWRQRDYLARSLPELLLLIDPALIHKHIWPVIQQLLSDGVNVVRDDALWAIPVLLKQYCADTLAHQWPHITVEHAKKFSAEACLEVITWIREEILKVGKSSSSSRTNKQQAVANFSDRQLYCRICAALGLALRFGQGECSMDSLSASASAEKTKYKDPVSVLSDKFKSFFFANKSNNSTEMNGPYQRLSVAEQRHLKKILMDDLLPLALSMKEDRISNVRITLMKGLQIMPADVREHADVKSVLKDLQEESETWTSFGAEEPPLIPPPQAHEIHHEQHHHHPSDQESSSGPVDVDNVHVTPHGSSDEDDAGRRAS